MAQEQQDVDTLKRRGRRRLVGAVALVLLAVIVLPMVFDEQPRQSAPQISVRVPGEDETPFNPKPPAAKKLETKKVETKKVETKKIEPRQETAKAEEFIVPVGAFSNPDGVVAKLKAAKVPHYTEPLPGNLTRVRAGPFPSRDAAEKALHKLKGLGLEPGAVASRSG